MNTFLPRTLASVVAVLGVVATVAAAPTAHVAPADRTDVLVPGHDWAAEVTASRSFADGSGPMGAGHHEEVFFSSYDGTSLHADVLLPAPPDEAPEGGWPVIISVGPYFNDGGGALSVPSTSDEPVERFADFIVGADIFANGYAWAQVDSRGYGASGGCNDFGGIGEQMDAAASVEFFGSGVDWSNGRVGMWGKSYDAFTQVMALAMNPPHLHAAVIQAPLIETYRGLWENGVHMAVTWHITPSLYMLYDVMPPAATNTEPEAWRNWAESMGRAPECYAEGQAIAAAGYDHDLPYWQERDLVPRARDSRVPVLWTHGFNDVNTQPNNILDVYAHLADARGWFGHWDHKRGNEEQHVGRPGFLEEALDFFDVHLKGEPAFDHPANAAGIDRVQTQFGDWYATPRWPAPDVRHFPLELVTGTYVDAAGASDADAADGIWTFTEEFPHRAHLSGEPVFHVAASAAVPNANLIVKVFDVSPSGKAELVSRGALLLEETGEPDVVTFEAYPNDWVVEPGHRLGILLTSDDPEFAPRNTNATVTVSSAIVDLPFKTAFVEYGHYGAASSVARGSRVPDGLFASNTVAWEFPPETN